MLDEISSSRMDEFHKLPLQSISVNLHKHGIKNNQHLLTEIINVTTKQQSRADCK